MFVSRQLLILWLLLFLKKNLFHAVKFLTSFLFWSLAQLIVFSTLIQTYNYEKETMYWVIGNYNLQSCYLFQALA